MGKKSPKKPIFGLCRPKINVPDDRFANITSIPEGISIRKEKVAAKKEINPKRKVESDEEPLKVENKKQKKKEEEIVLEFVPLPDVVESNLSDGNVDENNSIQESKSTNKTFTDGITINDNPTVNINISIEGELGKITDSTPWTEKYRPKKLDQFVGNENQVKEIQKWLRDHAAKKDGTKLALIITGPPGCGKTTIARLVAEGEGYNVQEFNINSVVSGKRDKKMKSSNPNNEASIVVDGIIPAMLRKSFGGKHVVVVDQADDIASDSQYKALWKIPEKKQDRVSKPMHGILQPVKMYSVPSRRITKIVDGNQVVEDVIINYWPAPLMMTVNDLFAKSLKSLRKATVKDSSIATNRKEKAENSLVQTVYFSRVPVPFIVKRLQQICTMENIQAKMLEKIAQCSMGDVRRAVMMLQEACRITQKSSTGKRIMKEDQVMIACSMFSIERNPKTDSKSFDLKTFRSDMEGMVTPSMENDDEGFIPDLNVQDITNIILREKYDRNRLEHIVKKYESPFLQSMLYSMTPKIVQETENTNRHPYILDDSNDKQDNTLTRLAIITDNWSMADIYSREGGWKRNDLYDYYIQHQYINPTVFCKTPDQELKGRFFLDWDVAMNDMNSRFYTSRNMEKAARLKKIFDTDILGLWDVASYFYWVSQRWGDLEFVEKLSSNLEKAAQESRWFCSKPVYTYFSTKVKNIMADLRDIHLDSKKTSNTDIIEEILDEEFDPTPLEKQPGGRKKKKDDSVLDLNIEEAREKASRLGAAQDNFAKFLAINRITADDLKDLFSFSIASFKGGMKEFCGKVKGQKSLGKRLEEIWEKLEKFGIHPNSRSGRFEKELMKANVQVARLLYGNVNNPNANE